MKAKRERTVRRARRVRSRIRGSAECPRLCVQRSLKHVRAQLIDDVAGRTIVSVSDTEIKMGGKPVEVARAVGTKLAEKALSAGVTAAVFDRGSRRYTGRVAALAEGAREGGLNF